MKYNQFDLGCKSKRESNPNDLGPDEAEAMKQEELDKVKYQQWLALPRLDIEDLSWDTIRDLGEERLAVVTKKFEEMGVRFDWVGRSRGKQARAVTKYRKMRHEWALSCNNMKTLSNMPFYFGSVKVMREACEKRHSSFNKRNDSRRTLFAKFKQIELNLASSTAMRSYLNLSCEKNSRIIINTRWSGYPGPVKKAVATALHAQLRMESVVWITSWGHLKLLSSVAVTKATLSLANRL